MTELTPVEYYRDHAVRARVREYCGATGGGAPTCGFVVAMAPAESPTWECAAHVPFADLDGLLDQGRDVARSMWDHDSLIVHLDLDYQNPEAPGDVFIRPAHAFFQLEPVFEAVRDVFTRFGMPMLTLMTGRGYHFTGRVPISGPVVQHLAGLAPEEALHPGPFADRPPDVLLRERAALGVGMVMEHVAHLVVWHAAHGRTAPVVLNGTEVGYNLAGREAISIDLSFAGDPLSTRHIRTAFSTYQLHRLRPDIFGAAVAGLVPPLAAVPRSGRSFEWMLAHARDLRQARELAGQSSTALPDVSAGLEALVAHYRAAPLAAFHADFHAVSPPAPADWPETYDRLDPGQLLPCVGHALLHPNDALLKPAVLQHLTRALLAAGWHPRHIAGLVTSKYARDHGWGDRWTRLQPARRAEFDVRVFAGMIATGLDRLIDFNCVSAQEKGLCPRVPCRHDLRVDRDRLLREVVA
jgi:hypothetical protein